MTNSPCVEKPHFHAPQGRRSALANGHDFYSGVDLSGAPENNIKTLSREAQEVGKGSEEPATPDSNITEDGVGGPFVKVDNPDHDSPGLPDRLSIGGKSPRSSPMEEKDETAQQQQQHAGSSQPIGDPSAVERVPRSQSGSFSRSGAGGRQAGPPRRQVQASRPTNPAYMGPHGGYGGHPTGPIMPGPQQYSQVRGQQGPRHPASNGGHAHHQAYHAESMGTQSSGMTMVYNQQYGPDYQAHNMPVGMYAHQGGQSYGYMYQPGVMWSSQYDPNAPPQGPMRPTTAPLTAIGPTMQYPMLPQESWGAYFAQTASVQPVGPGASVYYGYPGAYDPYGHAPLYHAGAFPNAKSTQERTSRQPAQYQPSSGPTAPSVQAQQGFKVPSAAVTADPSRGKPGTRRQISPPSRAEVDRELRHRRQSSLPGSMIRDRDSFNSTVPTNRGRGHRRMNSSPAEVHDFRLQIQKGGDAASRRHRRTRSTEDSKLMLEAGPTAGILEAIKTNRGNQHQLKDIAGSVYDLCKDQFGSRFIQMKIETATPEEVASAFNEVCVTKETTQALMNDVFGNYVVQKFLDYGTEQQRARMADMLEGSVKMLSLQVYGCRVIQKAIEVLCLPLKINIVEELKGQVIECIADQNGNHVIQKCIECIIPSEPITTLLEELASPQGGSAVSLRRASVLVNKNMLTAGFVPLARHPYGCRVVQRILEKCTLEDYKHRLVETVTENALELSRDTYGNYVIQHSLAYGTPEQRVEIIERLQDHIVELSTHKFASNVVEKCLQHGTRDQRRRLVGTMMGEGSGLPASEADQLLHTMTKDQYGNYVVQKTLEVCTDEEREVLLIKIKDFLTNLKKQQYGKHIVMRIEKLLTNAAAWVAQRKAGIEEDTEETGSPPPMQVQEAFEQLEIAPESPESDAVAGAGTAATASQE